MAKAADICPGRAQRWGHLMRRSGKGLVDSHKTLTRRGLIVGGAQAALVGALALRMRQLQIRDAEKYRMLAEENRINLQLIAPARGRIPDRLGTVQADNEPTYHITISRERAGDMPLVLKWLQPILPLTDEKVSDILAQSACHGKTCRA